MSWLRKPLAPHEFWSIGDYAVVGDLWSAVGRSVAAGLSVEGRVVVDLATGTGVTAIAAATGGAASVVGVDVTETLLVEAAQRARSAGVDIDWVRADLQMVPLRNGVADLVVSTFGLIFASDPDGAVDECRRLVRGAGRIVFTSWSGDGLFAKMRRVMNPYFPETPEPWHESPAGISSIAGDGAVVERAEFPLKVASAEDFVAQLEQFSAPFVVAAESLGDRWQQARSELVAAVAAEGSPAAGGFVVPVSYLVTTLDGSAASA